MAIDRQRQNVSYGLSQALIGVPPAPIVSDRAPTTGDKAEIGTLWVNKTTSISYTLIKVASGSATWYPITTAGVDVVAASFTATTGDIDVTLGDITVSAGDIFVLAGSIGADLDIGCRSLFVTGDEGTGTASETAFTNVVDTTLSTGAGKVLMKTANPGDSSGWMKIYVGTDVRYIPFWTNLSP